MARRVRLLTVSEAARLLRIGRSTCYRIIAAGLLPSIKVGEGRRFVRRAAVNAYLRANERRGLGEAG